MDGSVHPCITSNGIITGGLLYPLVYHRPIKYSLKNIDHVRVGYNLTIISRLNYGLDVVTNNVVYIVMMQKSYILASCFEQVFCVFWIYPSCSGFVFCITDKFFAFQTRTFCFGHELRGLEKVFLFCTWSNCSKYIY